jgi:disulfide bond formation protein DsbB
MLVAVQLSVVGLYRPPVLKMMGPLAPPPQTIISPPLSVQTAVCWARPSGALVVLVAVQLFVMGLYLPPVFKATKLLSSPPQTIISLPVQTAVWSMRASGALVRLVAVHVSSVHRPEGVQLSD